VSKQGGYYSDHYGQLVDDKEHYDYLVEMYLQMNTDSPAQVVAQAKQFKDDLSADAQSAENSDKVLDKEVETTRISTPEEIFQTSPMEVNLRNHMMKAAESDPKFVKDPVAKKRFHDFLTDIGLSRILKSFSPEVPEKTTQEVTYLQVPFREKDQAKALGAQWDKEKRAWYVPEDMPVEGFSKWMAKDRQQQVGPSNRLYLIVPYSERGEAKSAGALWDNTVKSWYAGPRADQSRLQRWNVENVTRQQSPAMMPCEEFASALKVLGCIVDAEHPIMDGTSHRISVEGDKANQQSGFYVGYLDGCPAGYIKNNRTGVETRWKGMGYNLSQDQKAKLQAEATARLKERTEVQEQTQKLTAQRVVQQMERLVPIEQPTPYLVAKGIAVHAGVFTDQEGKTTFVPAFDAEGKQWTMQYIQADGTKRFAKEGRKDGCFHPVGGMDALAAAPVLMIAEGYATAASLAEATGQAVVAAFDSGNLESVARALNDKYPSKAVVIAGDDDRHLDMTHGINPGRSKAQAAAQAVGGKLLMPIFAPGENTYPPDLHQFTPQEFLTNDEMKEELQAAQEGYLTLSAWQIERRQSSLLTSEQMAAIEKMKAHTDFNDLACKSSLGKEGVQRQALAAIAQVLQTQNSRKSAQANTLKPKQTDKQQFKQSRSS
jgi:putative DNA primase/helicase